MKLTLAPMEGVVDFQMRKLLTKLGGYDLCVTEFVRVVDITLSRRKFFRTCPELANGGFTDSGTPVRVQLLGQEPSVLAANARKAIMLGSHGIDLNFGCPAKAVNKSRGGAVLLQDPQQMFNIISAVRDAVPSEQVVSAKIRLGYDDDSNSSEIVDAVQQAGASALVIHARTKRDGYNPPAYWEKIPALKQRMSIPVTANGEIWSVADALLCQTRSGCDSLMLGRGALAMPDLAAQIRAHVEGRAYQPISWLDIVNDIVESAGNLAQEHSEFYFSSRLKQWLVFLKRQYPQAQRVFNCIRTLHDKQQVLSVLYSELNSAGVDSNHNDFA
ncbi:tRNA dihydrouridine synthase [Pseudoalteromonas fenneropenaei]|uniref:tRNA-dihydrouridine(16) synthase n=1 Tax=Pseudoalteromonas fenneropenaei TaxID=1737459 RepID=A0ABV7CIH7_9GAMM